MAFYPSRQNGAAQTWASMAATVWVVLLAGHVARAQIQLHDATKATGIDFVHTDGSSGQKYIVETVCCGLATFDYDNDGDIDIYFANGAPLRGTKVTVPPTHALYRNDGKWKFTNVTRQAGVGVTAYGLGVCAGDYDNDGDQDLFLDNYGPNILLRNNGNGTFTDAAKAAGVANTSMVGAGACFLDCDGDGDLDIYAAHYVDFTYQNHRMVRFNGYPAYVGPMDYHGTPDSLYRNNGNGTFTDVSVQSGIAAHPGTGMGTVCADYDNDGDTDIVVGNDKMGNFVFQNDGKGKFKEVGLPSGLAYDLGGNAQGTMGVDCADYNNDGLLDFYATSYQQELATLYKNLGNGFFEDVTRLTNAGSGTLPYVTWGPGLVDFDNDGDRDIFVACGHLHDNVELFDNLTSYHVRNIVLMNTGEGKFVNVSDRCGDGLLVQLSSRGAAFDDLDNDGDIDGVILNSRREPTILRNMLNESGTKNHWLQIRLRGIQANRDGVGSHVLVTAGDLRQIDEVHSGRGYQSHFGMRLHFGLGPRTRVDRVEVRWLGGGVDVFEDVPVDRLVTLTESTSPTQSSARAPRP